MRTRIALIFAGIVAVTWGLAAAWLAGYGCAWTPDSHEYFNLARNLAEGSGYVLDIKFHYFRDFPVRHAGWGERPPLYPLLLAGLMTAAGSGPALFAANLLFAALAAGCAFLVCRRLGVPLLPAALGGLLVAANPWIFDISLGLHSEPPLLLLTYLFVLLLPAADDRPWRWARAGLVAGLAGLLRGNGLLLLASGILYLLLRRPRGLALRLTACLAPYLLLAAVVPVNAWLAHGEPWYDIHASHYCLPAYDLAIWQGFEYPYPTATGFICSNPGLIVRNCAENLLRYSYDFCLPWLFMFFLPLLVGVNWRGPGARHCFVLVLAAGLNLLLVASFWSHPPTARFLIPLLAQLIPVALRALAPDGLFFRALPPARRLRLRRLLTGYCALVLAAFVWQDVRQGEPHRGRARRGPHAPAVYADTLRMLPADAVVAATDPWVVANVARVPSAIIPEFTDQAQCERWLARYRFSHLVLDRLYTPYGRAFIERRLPELIAGGRLTVRNDDGRLLVLAVTPPPAAP